MKLFKKKPGGMPNFGSPSSWRLGVIVLRTIGFGNPDFLITFFSVEKRPRRKLIIVPYFCFLSVAISVQAI